MKLQRIYLDTSVIGGCHDIEFSTWSNSLMKDFKLKYYLPGLSQLTFDEINKTPKPVQDTLTVLLDYEPEILEITEPALDLSQQYINRYLFIA